jgi:hypothetical protein
MTWFLWAIMLLLQQGSSTWVGRAKAQDSSRALAIASVVSNAVWFLSQVIIVDNITSALKSHDYLRIGYTLVFYTAFCVIGNVGAHRLLIHHETRCG